MKHILYSLAAGLFVTVLAIGAVVVLPVVAIGAALSGVKLPVKLRNSDL